MHGVEVKMSKPTGRDVVLDAATAKAVLTLLVVAENTAVREVML